MQTGWILQRFHKVKISQQWSNIGIPMPYGIIFLKN